MLHEFVTENRAEIIERCRAKISSRPAPLPTDVELEAGVPLFLDQLVKTLRAAQHSTEEMIKSAKLHGVELLDRGFTIAQVVHDYGGICQTITELAIEKAAPITNTEFKTLNLCLDDSIAEAVTAFAGLRDYKGTERLGLVAHELRNLLSTALLSFDVLKSGKVGIGGSTGAVLGRSLTGLRKLVERELAEVRIGSGSHHLEPVVICEFIAEVEVAAAMEASTHQLQLSVPVVPRDVIVDADRQILASVVANLLQNAFKCTPAGGLVALRVRITDQRVLIDVEDQCGGLPAGKAAELFRSFEQRNANRTGLGLGLSVCLRGAEVNHGTIRVADHPGTGCTFTVDLPRATPPAR